MTNKPNTVKNATNIWYKNYMMIVFVIGLPALVVMTCIIFVVYAIRHQDSTVRDDWYMDGKALYQDASKDQRAYDLGISGVMRFDNNKVIFELNYPDAKAGQANYPQTLNAQISHATDKTKDRDFVLSHQSANIYTGQVQLDTSIAAKYYLQISPTDSNNQTPSNQWRLIHAHKLPAGSVPLAPLAAFAER